MTKYFEFQLPLAFIKECRIFPVFIAIAPVDLKSYDNEIIDSVLNHPTSVVDIGRVRFRFGDDDEGMLCGREDEDVVPGNIINRLTKASQRYNINLSSSEARAILAYCSSSGGEYQQGGIFRVAEMFYSFIFNLVDQGVGEKKTLGLRIKRIDENLELTFQEEIYRFSQTAAKDKWLHKKDPLFKTTITYLLAHRLTVEDNIYKIYPQERLNNHLIAENVWLDMVRSVCIKLQKSVEFSFEELLLIPFLSDPDVRDIFCKKLSKQNTKIQDQALHFINTCFSNDMVTRNTILSRAEIDAIVSKPKVTFKEEVEEIKVAEEKKEKVSGINILLNQFYSAALEQLHQITQNTAYDQQLRSYAKSVLQVVKELSPIERNQNITFLIEVLERTTLAITDPQNSDNLKQYELLIKPLLRSNNLKLAVSVALFITGSAIICFVSLLATASVTAPTLMTIGLIGFGMSIIVSSLALIGSIEHNKVSASTMPFWCKKNSNEKHNTQMPEHKQSMQLFRPSHAGRY